MRKFHRGNPRPYEEKPCAMCGKMFGPKWQARRNAKGSYKWETYDRPGSCCGLKCANVLSGQRQRVTPSPKQCEACGRSMPYQPVYGPGHYAKKRFCDNDCVHAGALSRRIPVAGVLLPIADVARLVGGTETLVRNRARRGYCPLSGRRK